MNPLARPRDSILPRLIASIIGAVTVLSFAFVGPMIFVTAARLERELESAAEKSADRLAESLKLPAWNLVTGEIEVQLALALSEGDAHSAALTFRDIDEPPISVSAPEDPAIRASRLVVERRAITYRGQEIADLELTFTRAFMERRLAAGILQQAMLIGSLDATLIVVLLLLLRAFIVIPLRRIEHWAAGVSAGNSGSLPPGGERGEIASLRLSIGDMVELLDQRYRAMLSREREYRSLFENSPVATWEIDCSAIKEELGESGRAEPSHIALMRVRGANAAALRPLGVSSPPRGLMGVIGGSAEAFQLFEREIESLRGGLPGAHGDVTIAFPNGARRTYTIRFAVLAGHEEDWSRVIVTAEDITDRVEGEESLRRSLAEKETLVQELFHRTHNSLQIIDSVISLRSSKSGDRDYLREMRALELRVRAMAMAQDQLTKSGDLSQIDLGEYLRELLSAIAAEAPGPVGRIRVEVAADSLPILIDAAVPIGLIAVELAANSIDHAFPYGREGVISAALERGLDGAVCLSIGDDGIGPPAGFDPRADASLGLQTAIALAEGQLRGSIDFDSSRGLRCSLRFDDSLFERRV